MKNIDITYSESYRRTPVTFWVHKLVVSDSEFSIKNYEPPLSEIIGGKGYPLVRVKYMGVELLFSSIEEISHVQDVLSMRNMPTSMALSQKWGSGVGPNQHWLSRLPAKLKPWRKREPLLPLLNEAKCMLESVYS